MAVFSSLGELSSYLEGRGSDARVVDAGVPLSHYMAGGDYGPVWRSQPSVRKVVGFIARNLASIPLHVYDRRSDTDRERVRTGALADVISRPSRAPGMTRYRLWESLLIDGLLNDRWLAMKVRRDDGGLDLVRVPAHRARFNTDGLDRIESISMWTEGREQKLDPARFVFDVGYSERGGRGTSPLVTMQHLLDEAREAVDYRRQVWRRGARVPAVVQREQGWPKTGNARERFLTQLGNFSRGGGQEGGILLLEDGMKMGAIDTFNPKDVADLEGRRLTDVEVCSSYYVAPELLGIRQGNYSNVDAFRQMLWGVSLGPYIVAWEQALAVLVDELAPGTDLYVEANVDAKLRGSFEDQAKYLQTATGAPYLTRNEARGRLNQPAIEGGDELVVPLNVLVGGQASPTDSGTQNLKGRSTGARRAKARAPQTHEAKHTEVLTSFFARQRSAVLSRLGAGEDWWDGARWDRELAIDMLTLAVTTSTAAAVATLEELGVEADQFDPDQMLAFLTENTETAAGNVNDHTLAELEQALAEAEASEDEDTSTVDAAGHVFDVAESSRVPSLATAAVTAMSAFGTVEAGRQSGASTKTWRTGSNPRSAHARMDGETVAILENFSNGLAWPGDARGDADDLAGCNCELDLNY